MNAHAYSIHLFLTYMMPPSNANNFAEFPTICSSNKFIKICYFWRISNVPDHTWVTSRSHKGEEIIVHKHMLSNASRTVSTGNWFSIHIATNIITLWHVHSKLRLLSLPGLTFAHYPNDLMNQTVLRHNVSTAIVSGEVRLLDMNL